MPDGGNTCSMCNTKLVPDFDPKYVEAFIHLMLHKLGGFQTIPLEKLKDFPAGQESKIYWDEQQEAFTISIPDVKVTPKKRIIHNKQIITPN